MLRSEYQSLGEEIARRTRAEVFAIARKALQDLAGSDLEVHMVEVFVNRLRSLDAAEIAQLTSTPQPSVPVLVRSAFELPPPQRALIESAVTQTLAAAAQVRFEIAPDLISGIELIVMGRKIAWSIADHMAALEKDVDSLLKAQPRTEVPAESKPK